MKITIPAFKPQLECTEHLRHEEIEIELGENVIEVTRCKDCAVHKKCGLARVLGDNGYCSCGKRSS